VTAVDLGSLTLVATLTLRAPQGTESPSDGITTVTALDSASRHIIATFTVTPAPGHEQPTTSAGAAFPSLVNTDVTAVYSQSPAVLATSVYTAIVDAGGRSAALTTVIPAIDSASRTVFPTLTLVPTSTPNIGDLVCSGIGRLHNSDTQCAARRIHWSCETRA
jgi:hypothetical protein